MGGKPKGGKAKKDKKKAVVCIQEGDRLKHSEYHFLELLFLFCKKKERTCHPESHRSFCINKPDGDTTSDSFCILFKVDRQAENDPLIQEGSRPDYLVLYVSPNKCLATIIEMKSKGMERGVEQVIALYTKLKQSFAEHLPGAWRIQIQAIILGAPNSSIPERKIQRVKNQGLHIFPLCYAHRFELFDYISEDMTKNAKKYRNYQHRDFKRAKAQFTDLETIFINCALPMPSMNEYCFENRKPLSERIGVYLDYVCGEAAESLTFHTTPHELHVIAPDSCKEIISEEITRIGLPKVHFK